MKKTFLLTAFLLSFVLTYAQSLSEIHRKYIQPRSSADDLRKGFKKVELLCEATPEEKCDKAKASALYLLSDRYYAAAYQVVQIDYAMSRPILAEAKELFDRADSFMAIDKFEEYEKNIMLEHKQYFEAYLKTRPE